MADNKRTLTINDVIKRKEQIKKKRNAKKRLYVESLDGEIVVTTPSRELCLESIDMDGYEGDKYIVYNSIVEPNICDDSLHKAYEVNEPLDIVDAIFEPGEISSIALELLNMSGYNSHIRVVEEIKN